MDQRALTHLHVRQGAFLLIKHVKPAFTSLMESTLILGDRILVNKWLMGQETLWLLPFCHFPVAYRTRFG